MVSRTHRRFVAYVLLVVSVWVPWGGTQACGDESVSESPSTLWVLQPIVRAEVPAGSGVSSNPIDRFLEAAQRQENVAPLPLAEPLTRLRRVCFDLIGLPPTVEQQERMLGDSSEEGFGTIVDQLLDDPQHGVRYARHWLDVLRYADEDERMPAADRLYLWRDWVIAALNDDVPYDQFVRAQITGYRSAERTTISATGFRRRSPPRPDDLFALGFLARGATSRDDGDQSLAISAVETISTAFMGMTVGCAKCHDHFYDPISQEDFYAMKALFDPLELQAVQMATAEQLFAYGQELSRYERARAKVQQEIDQLVQPYHDRVYDERVAMLPPDVQAVIRKPQRDRTSDEQKIADDYYPILRIDSPKLREVMPPEAIERFNELEKQLQGVKRPDELPRFWAVAESESRRAETRYVLNTGDATRPETNRPVSPGVPFAGTRQLRTDDGLREGFVDWLTSTENPLFARVAVNRVWQWHFGRGLHELPSDFGAQTERPLHAELLDWLAGEFIAHDYSMKWLHRTIVTSHAYQRQSFVEPTGDGATDAVTLERHYAKFVVERLSAEAVWDALHVAGNGLDMTVGGESFVPRDRTTFHDGLKRRGVYMRRGYQSSSEATPEFLRVFDGEDGRVPCPIRQQTVTAPQALWLLNSPFVHHAAGRFAQRLADESDGDLASAVRLGYRVALGRLPTETEQQAAQRYLRGDRSRLAGWCWLVFNLDEFIYIP